jgi:hypothetical protein
MKVLQHTKRDWNLRKESVIVRMIYGVNKGIDGDLGVIVLFFIYLDR